MSFRHRFPSPLLLLSGIGLVGCSEPPSNTQPPDLTSSIWVTSVPDTGLPVTELAEMQFFEHPWPSDLRLDNGKVKLANYPNPRGSGNITAYIQYMDRVLDGFSPAAAGYVRFSGPLALETLPTPEGSLQPDASVQLIDIDPESPDYGQRQLVSLRFRQPSAIYYPSNILAFMPSPGFPLRPRTRYAFVVTDAVLDSQGQIIQKSPELAAVLGEVDPPDMATAIAKGALEWPVAEIKNIGLDPHKLIHLAVFTTNDPTEEMFAVRDHLRAHAPAPNVVDEKWRLVATSDVAAEYVGTYGPSPNYQHGLIPFSSPRDGGGFNFVGDEPVIADSFDLRFSLTIPTLDTCPPPATGYPIALYAHGTGGNFRSYVRDGTADSLAAQCIASMGVDQIFHGKRPGAPPPDDADAVALRFFNVDNVIAARTSNRQSALDEVQRARLFTETKIQIPAKISIWGQPISFDPARVMFFGHSQGGLNGPLFLAADDQALGGVLSGSGAVMSITLTQKTKPAPSVAYIVKKVMLGLQTEEFTEVDLFHPALSFAQMLVDVTDPIHYARHIIKEPRAHMKPKSIYMTVGIDNHGEGDSYSPPRGIEMHAVAMGLPLITNGQQFEIPEMLWQGGPGILPLPPPSGSDPYMGVQNNLANMQATGGLAQWAPDDNRDGHFVVFDVAGAREQAALFIRTMGIQGTATLVNTQ